MDVMCILSSFSISTTLHMEFEYIHREICFSIFHIVFPNSTIECVLSMYKILSKEIPSANIELSFHIMWVVVVVLAVLVMIEFDILYRIFEGLNWVFQAIFLITRLCVSIQICVSLYLFIHFIAYISELIGKYSKFNIMYRRNTFAINMRCGCVHTSSNEAFFYLLHSILFSIATATPLWIHRTEAVKSIF